MISTLLLALLLLIRSFGKIYKRAKENGTPSNYLRTGHPLIFNDAEKQRLVDFATRDVRTRCLAWEAICLEMGYACSARTVRNVMVSMGYHKRIPRRKFNIRPYNKPLRIAWCQERLHWTYEEWKRELWTDESSFQQPDSVTGPGLYESQMRSTMLMSLQG